MMFIRQTRNWAEKTNPPFPVFNFNLDNTFAVSYIYIFIIEQEHVIHNGICQSVFYAQYSSQQFPLSNPKT